MAAPSVPTGVATTVGSALVQVRWGKPTSTGGKAISGYVVKAYTASDNKFVKQLSVAATTFAASVTQLANGTAYYFRVYARNADGTSAPAQTANVTPHSSSTAVVVSVTSVGPNKVANTRAGQSLADAPQVKVKGTNLDQGWGTDASHVLEWVLYTNSTFSTVVGSGGHPRVATQTVSSLMLSSPVAPGNADVDANHLIGPWRLKVTYTPNPLSGATVTVYSPPFYTTAVGTVVIGTITPSPAHDGDTVVLTGPDIGVCSTAIVDIGGNTKNAPLTRVSQNSASFLMPTFGYQAPASGTVVAQYSLNGNVMSSPPADIDWDPADGAGGSEDPGDYVPPTAVDIRAGDQEYPIIVERWVFTCPATGETYTVPRNPDAMTSPFPQRNVQSKFTTAITGQALLTEGSPTLANWQFSGKVADARHYEMLRHWVEDINSRVVITDHYGRDIECVLLNFNPTPKRDMHRYWSHEYQITALVIKVGAPTAVPA